MFPQLDPSVGFLLATLTFLGLSALLTEGEFADWGWRLPFVASALLMLVGLYVRLNEAETPAFLRLQAHGLPVATPLRILLRDHKRTVIIGGVSMMIC